MINSIIKLISLAPINFHKQIDPIYNKESFHFLGETFSLIVLTHDIGHCIDFFNLKELHRLKQVNFGFVPCTNNMFGIREMRAHAYQKHICEYIKFEEGLRYTKTILEHQKIEKSLIEIHQNTYNSISQSEVLKTWIQAAKFINKNLYDQK